MKNWILTAQRPQNTMLLEMFAPFIKSSIIGVIAMTTGWISGMAYSLAFQVPSPQWYEHPAVVSAFVTALFLVVMKIMDLRSKKQEMRQNEERDEEERHLNFSEKLQELTHEERRALLGGLNSLHEKEVGFLQGQLEIREVSEFELRERAHAFANEVNRLILHIQNCQILMATNGIEIPEFKPKHYNQIIEGVPEKVIVFRDTLRAKRGV